MPLSQEGVKKKKKLPACDICKARRVLCHPQPDGKSCPRCIERNQICTTTPVARGRPPKPNLGMAPASTQGSVSEESESFPSASASDSSPSLFQNIPQHLALPPELVHHLFECFVHLPHHHHPMFRGTVLHDALSSVSWQIHLLPPELKVLAHCVIALSASISTDHAIIGPGSKPASLADRSVFSRGADLREYGVRRAPMYRALCAEVLRLAFEVGVTFEPSEHNAVSCFILQFIENEKEARSRPFGVAYLSHVRAICESWVDIPDDTGIWAAYLLMEVMETTQRRQPVSVSHHDQLLMTGGEPLSLQNLCVLSRGALQGRKEREQLLLFAIMGPYIFHVTRVARQLYEEITGDFARRHPLKENSITEVISSLTQLHSIWSLIFEHDEPETHPGDSFFCLSPNQRDRHLNIRSCAFLMTCSRATLVLALHRELVRRAAVAISPPPPTGHGAGAALADLWAAERLTLLRRQVKDMADATVLDVARALRSMPSLPHIAHSQRDAVVAWAEFCLDEADATGSVLPERAATMETISSALKLVGYSWQLPLGLVERLDAYVDTHRQLILPFLEDSMFVDMFPEPLDNDWMSMFTMPLSSELFAQSHP